MEREQKGFTWKFFKTVKGILLIVIVTALAAGCIYFYLNSQKKEQVDTEYLINTLQKSSELTSATLNYKGFSRFTDTGWVLWNKSDFSIMVVILFVLFLMMNLMPGSPFNDEKLTESQKALLYAKYGLDQPFLIRFGNYFVNMLKGDLGVSYVINKNKAVSDLVAGPLWLSIKIGFFAMVIGTILGLLLGIAAALKHNTWVDTLCSVIAIIGVSVPSYVFALLLAYYIGFKLQWTPILYNASNPIASSILPVVALSMFPIANISRFTRSEMIDVLNSDYILLVQAKGVPQGQLIRKHALRNTLIPIVTIMGPLLVNLLTGSMVVEKVFGIPGIGMLMVNAITNNDYNVVIACAFVYSAMYIVMMLILDILYGIIDPRIRVAKEGN